VLRLFIGLEITNKRETNKGETNKREKNIRRGNIKVRVCSRRCEQGL
jgi:hypothetical protein